MNDTAYLEKTTALYEELAEVSSVEPFDLEAWQDVNERIIALHFAWRSSRRRRPWLTLASCIILLIVLVGIVYSILSLSWIRGTT